ncbi:DUF1501 domain-containing protein [Calycomorphotria hydatis]|uniref:Sulfatase n=1 Tax=Calycomorphotria hydatis TaxID=2528027 RepID=A0A517T9T3_9PLAN|nr:DUF1501 domain-containing protein [Calycomorphotria hydatis]QDT65126.1 hypothetical protein V22_23730 [Calycomorphotria hydatis]
MNIPGLELTRREYLLNSGIGFGALALKSMLFEQQLKASGTDTSTLDLLPHFKPRVKNIIFLFMSGGPSHVDTWDPKPLLGELDEQSVPNEIAKTVPNIPRSGVNSKVMASPFKFSKHGESGLEVSELLPETAKHVDDICVIRSLNHRIPVHGPGETLALTGSALGERPSMGAWIDYGLGSECQNLPGYVVMLSESTGPAPQRAGWGTGFLPAKHQGTVIDGNRGLPYSTMPSVYTKQDRQVQLEFINWMNRRQLVGHEADSELQARIESYELGFRMQMSAPETFDISNETDDTRKLYGLDEKATSTFGRHCLLARRMVEQGVRFIQLRNGGWDAHGSLKGNHIRRCRATDRPIAGLLQDLKQRGLWDDTLVIWGGEFGRTPTTEGSAKGEKRGRDHSPAGYTMWLAGGGIRGGQVIGATDELGYVPIDRPVTPHDFHATLLHALGLDQHKLFFLHNNREEIATVLGGEVIKEVFS